MNNPVYVSRATMGHDAMQGLRTMTRALSITLTIRARLNKQCRNVKYIQGGKCWKYCPLVRFSWETNYER